MPAEEHLVKNQGLLKQRFFFWGGEACSLDGTSFMTP